MILERLACNLATSSLLIALPVIFRGIHLDPLAPANFPYLLWMMMGYMLVTAALVVTAGRIGDIFGRVKMYNLGFAWFTLGALLLSCVWSTGPTGALELVIFRMFQAIGGALLMANSAAIITDAFPSEQLERILKRFEREGKALARLSHPNIVGVIDYGEFEGSPYLVMEYLPGGTLKQRLGSPIPWQEAARRLSTRAICRAKYFRLGAVLRATKTSALSRWRVKAT